MGQNIATSGQKPVNYRVGNRTKIWMEKKPRVLTVTGQQTRVKTTTATTCDKTTTTTTNSVVKMPNVMKSVTSPCSIIFLVFLSQLSSVNSGRKPIRLFPSHWFLNQTLITIITINWFIHIMLKAFHFLKCDKIKRLSYIVSSLSIPALVFG